MATTTITAFRTALESTIKGLTPGGASRGKSKFQKAGVNHSWEERPKTDWDRRFTVGFVEEGTAIMFGVSTTYDYTFTFNVFVGHTKSTSEDADMDRLNEDVRTIREQLEDLANFPTGVALIRFENSSMEEREQGYLTVLAFRGVYSRAAP